MEFPALEPPMILTMQVVQESFPAARKMECPEMMEPLRSAIVECPQDADSSMPSTVENPVANQEEEYLKTSVEECQKEEARLSTSATQEYPQNLDSSMSASEAYPMEATSSSKSSIGTEPLEETVLDRGRHMDSEDQVELFDNNEMGQPNGASFQSVPMSSMNYLMESEDQPEKESRKEAEKQGPGANECHQAEPIHTPTVECRESIIELPISTTIEYSGNIEMSKTVTVPVQTIYPILQRKECSEKESEFDREENTEIPMVLPDQNRLPSEEKDNMKSIESKFVPVSSDSPESAETKAKIKKYMNWMEKEQDDIESSDFGSNRVGVDKAKENIKAIKNDIKRQSPEIKEFLQNQDPRIPEVREANLVFETLNAVIDKQSACLDVVSEIAALEANVQSLSLNFDTTAVHLVNAGTKEHSGNELSNVMSHQNLLRSSQKCNLAVRKNWQWVGQMLQCAQVHFNHAADFHQFFHDAEEAEYWMKNTLANIHLTFDRSKLQGDMIDIQSMKEEMKEVLSAYIQWQAKIDSMFDRAKNVLPVPQRIIPIEDSRPAKALLDYRTDEFEITEGESISLLDNSDKSSWKVKNSRGQVGMVPAVLVLIPGPYPNAIDTAIKMRIQLLALWTASVKRLGYKLIAFMLLVIKDYNEEEIMKLGQMTGSQRKELLLVLKYIEDAMVEYWGGYKDFEELQERIHRIRLIFEEENATFEDGSEERFSSSVVVQVGALKELLAKYKDFWAYWETYKVIVELIKQPKFILICDQWEQLRFVTTAHFVRFWDTHLDVNTVSEIDKIDQVVSDKCLAIHETPRESMGTSDVTVSTELEETETEQVETSVEEEERTFFMKNVVDPRDNALLSFQHAVMLGIVDQTNNRYINPNTGESIPIREAINAGHISLEWTSRRKIREEKRSYGLITIKTTRETRPYTILEVIDPKTEKPISVAEAMEGGILDTHNSVYKTKDGEEMQLAEAIDLHKVIVEYGGNKNQKPETITKTYAVSAVVDQRKRDKIPFAEAINSGILDKAHGCYVNNVTGEKIHIGEAILRGFIKARVVTDVSKLDINPENQIVVERIQNVRNKLMRGIKAINAMKGLKK